MPSALSYQGRKAGDDCLPILTEVSRDVSTDVSEDATIDLRLEVAVDGMMVGVCRCMHRVE